MSAVAMKLLEACKARGIRLRPGEGGKLKVSPPPEQLPSELRDELKRYKPELLRLLTKEPHPFYDDSREDQAPDILPWACPSCGGQVKVDPPVLAEMPVRFWSCSMCSAYGAARQGAPFSTTWVAVSAVIQ